MKKKLFLLLCALLTSVGMWAQPKASTPEVGKSYYLYNTKTGKFLVSLSGTPYVRGVGNAWTVIDGSDKEDGYIKLRLKDDDNGYLWGIYWAQVNENGPSTYPDETYYKPIKQGDTNNYKLLMYSWRNDNGYLYVNAGGDSGSGSGNRVAGNSHQQKNLDEGYTVWDFVTEEDYLEYSKNYVYSFSDLFRFDYTTQGSAPAGGHAYVLYNETGKFLYNDADGKTPRISSSQVSYYTLITTGNEYYIRSNTGDLYKQSNSNWNTWTNGSQGDEAKWSATEISSGKYKLQNHNKAANTHYFAPNSNGEGIQCYCDKTNLTGWYFIDVTDKDVAVSLLYALQQAKATYYTPAPESTAKEELLVALNDVYEKYVIVGGFTSTIYNNGAAAIQTAIGNYEDTRFDDLTGSEGGEDITSWITNPTPTANGTGWTLSQTPTYDSGNNVAEFWNKSAASLSQTIANVPAGYYRLTTVAFTRTGMSAPLAVSGATSGALNSMNITTVGSDVVNGRGGANTWFNSGHGVNELDFYVPSKQNVTISLTTDNTTGDHWMVWRSFKLTAIGKEEVNPLNLEKYLDNAALTRANAAIDDDAYKNIIGEERTNLVNATNALDEYSDAGPVASDVAARKALKYAIIDPYNTFTDPSTKASYDAAVAEFARVKEGANAIAEVSYTESVVGSHSTFTTEISTQTAAKEAATSLDDINSATNSLKAAVKAYINGAEPDGGASFEITCLIANPDFANNNIDGWNRSYTSGGNAQTNYHCNEFWNNTFNFYQDLTGLPNGSYQLSVQAFCRPGGNNVAYPAYKDGTNNAHAELYVNSDASTVGNIYAYTGNTTAAKVPSGNFADYKCVVDEGDDYWVPNGMEGASLYFEDQDVYKTEVAALVNDGNLRVGFRDETLTADQWTIFSNFRLYYYGSDKLVYYKQYLPQLKEEVSADLENGAYANVLVSSEDEALDAALAAEPASDTEEAYETVINNLKAAQAAFRAAAPSYDAMVAAKAYPAVTKVSANIGTGVFQYNETTNNTLFSAYETAKSAVDGYAFTTSSTAAGAQALVDALNTATSNYQGQTLNAPVAEKRYNLTIVEDGKAWNGYVITFREGAANTEEGNFGIKYQAANVNYNQAIKFISVDGNKYKMSVNSGDGTEMYLTTQKKGYNKDEGTYGDERIRLTSDVAKALEVEIRATTTDNEFQLYNNTAPGVIANNDNDDVYTAGNANFTISEASKATPNLTIAAGVNWATFMSPFAVSLAELDNVTAFKITGVDGEVFTTEEVTTTIPANTPVLLYRKTTDSNYAPSLTGYGAAYKEDYTDGLLTGFYAKTAVTENENHYLLQKNNGVVAFYNVTNSGLYIGAYRAYLTMPEESDARPALYFPEDPTAINVIEAVETEANALKDGKYLIEGKIVIVKNGVKYDANGKKLN